MSSDLRTDDFDFDLPSEFIAQQPASPRDSAQLLHVKSDGCADYLVRDLPDLLRAGDVLVLNDTRVIPARLYGRRGLVEVEILLHKKEAPRTWAVFAKPGKRLRAGDRIDFTDGLTADVIEKREDGEVLLRFSASEDELRGHLARFGLMPLPPYIKREKSGAAGDRADYQTIYAARDGAVAAPTAGLHFTHDVMQKLAAKGIERVTVTLHVGAGTFLPVKAEHVKDHVMHSEWGEITPAAAEALNRARAEGRRIVAVGTTSLRLLESAADEKGVLRPFVGDTGIFITPGYKFRAVDALLTNFHLPKSTLFMLVSAFAGMERMRAAYDYAKSRGYRFYSYGDATLLEKA